MRSASSTIFLLLLTACGARAHSTGSRGGGPAVAGSSERRFDEPGWGVRLLVEGPGRARRSADASHLELSTMGLGPLAEGTFALRIDVDPGRAAAGAEGLGAAAREAWVGQATASPLAPIVLFGRPGLAFTFVEGTTQGLHAVAVVGRCVVELIVLSEGPAEGLGVAARRVLGRLTAEPSPLDPANCRP